MMTLRRSMLHYCVQGWVAVPLTTLHEVEALVTWAASHGAIVHEVRLLHCDRKAYERPW